MADPAPAPPALLRTHLAEDDTAWLPAHVRAAGAAVAGIGFLALSLVLVALVAIMVFWLHVIWLGIFSLSALPVTYRWRDAVARAVMRRRMGRLQRSALSLPPGETPKSDSPVRVRGRIRAQRTIPALLGDRRAVFRRLAFQIYSVHAVHEAAVDFLIDDGSGEPVLVLVDGARWLDDGGHPDDFAPLPIEMRDTLAALDPTPAVQDCLNDWKIDAARKGAGIRVARGLERTLSDGDTVEVIGYRSHVVDQTAAMRLARDTPFRAALQGSGELPLLITRAD
jgi:hypothetical protein